MAGATSDASVSGDEAVSAVAAESPPESPSGLSPVGDGSVTVRSGISTTRSSGIGASLKAPGSSSSRCISATALRSCTRCSSAWLSRTDTSERRLSRASSRLRISAARRVRASLRAESISAAISARRRSASDVVSWAILVASPRAVARRDSASCRASPSSLSASSRASATAASAVRWASTRVRRASSATASSSTGGAEGAGVAASISARRALTDSSTLAWISASMSASDREGGVGSTAVSSGVVAVASSPASPVVSVSAFSWASTLVAMSTALSRKSSTSIWS